MASNSQYAWTDAYLPTIPSNYDTTFMDAYLRATVSNYDKLFRQLELFNLAQKQLLQAICELAERLMELEEAYNIYGPNTYDFDDLHLREDGEHIERTFLTTSGCLYYFAFKCRLTPLNLAAKLGNVEMVNTLLACKRRSWTRWYSIPLHWAAKMGHDEVVNAILLNKEREFDVNETHSMAVDESLIVNRSSYGRNYTLNPFDVSKQYVRLYCVDSTPLQLASLYGHTSVVKVLCHNPKARLGATLENDVGLTALQIATDMKGDEIAKILTDIPEVEKQVKRLYRDRQLHVDAANAILVGAALIASVTFAGWLQPPLGYSPFFGSASPGAESPTPSGMYPSFVSVEGHPIMKIFWVFNSMSFFFAIATLMVGATAARPPKKQTYIGEVVQSLRTSLRLAYALLTVSVACVMGAFACAGFVVLPPIRSYTSIMQATVGIGVMVVFLTWTSSTLLKVLFKVISRIEDVVEEFIYKNSKYDDIIHVKLCQNNDPIGRILPILRSLIDLIKEKLQID